ncbi:related to SLS1 protein precursor [Cephalotrichum gorgonifer]|uniref:Related to SLS1 protein n=1 Tax=Cephalotrichum gorgonifer TaxID=2041049 RepID=A0AAE8SU68_9PEZI|nr:related to SLS1 protein precursor [Cephalotrichum gorgonifer]
MAPSRAPGRPFGHSLFLITLLLGIILVLVQPAVSSTPPAQDQEEAAKDLICHTDNPAECYPRVFEPTDEFQIIHPDQEVPPGLHVRLNIWNGEKEGKINVPDEIDPSLEGLPTDNAVVLVEQEGEPRDEPRIPKGAPEYEPVGQIKVPPVEEGSFFESIEVVKRGVPAEAGEVAFRAALENLLEMSSDIYYGLKLTENAEAVKTLLCLMVGGDASGSATADDGQAAARILAGAVQNNVKALAEVEKIWADAMASTCSPRDDAPTLEAAFYASLMPADESLLSPEEYSRAVSRVGSTVFAAKGLVQNPAIRDDFLAKGGMRNLVEILAAGDERWAPVQRKVGHLLLDTFLDPEGGATLGVWPQGQAAGDDGDNANMSSCKQSDAASICSQTPLLPSPRYDEAAAASHRRRLRTKLRTALSDVGTPPTSRYDAAHGLETPGHVDLVMLRGVAARI